MSTPNPIVILREFEARAIARAGALPEVGANDTVWTGVGFRIADALLAAPMSEIGEILHYPLVSRVPGAKAWINGIANVRGRLMSVVDLCAFLGGGATALRRSTRVLTVAKGEALVGLMVDEVMGGQHFPSQRQEGAGDDIDEWLRPYVTGRFVADGREWGVFDMTAVLANPEFTQAAA